MIMKIFCMVNSIYIVNLTLRSQEHQYGSASGWDFYDVYEPNRGFHAGYYGKNHIRI